MKLPNRNDPTDGLIGDDVNADLLSEPYSWRPNTVASILTNEKNKDDALLQKKFTVDFMIKTTKINEGEVQQFYVEGRHPAIVLPNYSTPFR